MILIKIIFYYLKIVRPINVMTSIVVMLISASIVNQLENIKIVLFTSLVVMFYTSGANALNDVVDSKVDLINRPRRPIPSGKVTILGGLIISFFCFLVGSLICLQLNYMAQFIGIVIALPLMVFYSTHLKGMFIYGNITIAFILGISFLFAGAAHGNTLPMWTPMFLSFGLTLIRELVKDVADIEGDEYNHLSTYPIIKGIDKTNKLIMILTIIVCTCSVIPYHIGIYGIWYLIILILGVEIPLGIVVILMLRNPGISNAFICAKILKFSTFAGLISIYLGTLN